MKTEMSMITSNHNPKMPSSNATLSHELSG